MFVNYQPCNRGINGGMRDCYESHGPAALFWFDVLEYSNGNRTKQRRLIQSMRLMHGARGVSAGVNADMATEVQIRADSFDARALGISTAAPEGCSMMSSCVMRGYSLRTAGL